MRAYHVTGTVTRLAEVDLPEPSLQPGEVIVEIRAASLNYRDLLQSDDQSGFVPLSDGAGIVCDVHPTVTTVQPGDRVAIGFMPAWVDGPLDERVAASALGAPGADGVLRERVAIAASAVVEIPDDMTFAEAATLPCAGVTAWTALFERRPLLPGETVLLLGTGGVSIFALTLAKKAGARVIITSSSDEKLSRARALGADETINYRTTPHWAQTVLALTGGCGADLAVDVGGPGTLNATLEAVRYDGRISFMGVLTGFEGPISTALLMRRRITLQGIYVGSVAMLAAVVRARPAISIDRTFAFERAVDAYAMMESAEHFGKLVIEMPDRA